MAYYLSQFWACLAICLVVLAPGLRADTDLRLVSPFFGGAKSEFQADNGSRFEVSQLSVEAEGLALDWRASQWRMVGLGTSIFVRYESLQVSATEVAAGSTTYRQGYYKLSAVAPSLSLRLFPFPDQRPLEPFVEGRLELYAFSELDLAGASVDRYRPCLEVGLRGEPNENGYFWGARLVAARRGISGSLGGVAIPDGWVMGLQVDWIGLEL